MVQSSFENQLNRNLGRWLEELRRRQQALGVSAQEPEFRDLYQQWAYIDQPLSASRTVEEAQAKPLPTTGYIEEDDPAYESGVRIWIQGIEFTKYLTGSVSRELGDASGDTTAQFSFTNEDDALVYTFENLRRILKLDEPPDFSLTPQLQFAREDFGAHEQEKRRMLEYKLKAPNNRPISGAFGTPMFPMFPVMPNISCLQKNDPVRIWTRVPSMPASANLWMPYFTGFLNEITIDDNWVNGESKVSLTARSIRSAVFSRMRVSTDFQVANAFSLEYVFGLDPKSSVVNASNSLFFDQAYPSDRGQPFIGLPVEKATKLLLVNEADDDFERIVPAVTGDPLKYIDAGTLNARSQRAAGKLGPTGVKFVSDAGDYEFDARAPREDKTAFLQDWHRLALYGPKRRPWTELEMVRVGEETTSDGVWAPNKVRFWRLIPAEGSGPKNLSDSGSLSSVATDPNWTTRAQLLDSLVSAAQYQFFVGPTGDLFLEFDMSDFIPEDFGEFSPAFKIDRLISNSTIADESGDLPCAVMATTNYDFSQGSAPSDLAANLETKAAAYAPAIAMRTGMEVETIGLPFLYRDTMTAAQICAIELSRKLADANQVTMQFAYRPYLLPNRPLEHVKRSRIGKTTNISDTTNIGVDPTSETTATINRVRRWTGYRRVAGEPIVSRMPPAKQRPAISNTAPRAEVPADALVSVTRSGTAKALGISNTVPKDLEVRALGLAEVKRRLEAEQFVVTSAFRSEEVNEAVRERNRALGVNQDVKLLGGPGDHTLARGLDVGPVPAVNRDLLKLRDANEIAKVTRLAAQLSQSSASSFFRKPPLAEGDHVHLALDEKKLEALGQEILNGLNATQQEAADEALESAETATSQDADAILAAVTVPDGPIYETITGGESTPMSSAHGWSAASRIAPGSGIILLPDRGDGTGKGL